MATKRSPILGYNHNFRHRGRVFHVQTEDSGVDNPHVFTHLFHGGVIITTRKLEYDSQASEEAVKALMQAQHKAVLRDLKGGAFDEKIVAYLGPHPEDEQVPEPEAAGPPAAERPPVEVTVEFTSSAAESAPVELQQLVLDEPGHAHVPMPQSPPIPPGSSVYIQGGGSVRKEAPLANTGQMRAIMGEDPELDAGDEPAIPRARPAGKSGRAAAMRPNRPPPIPSAGPRRPSRPPSKPLNRPAPAAAAREASARSRSTQPRAATQPRGDSGSGVVVSRPSVIVGAPPKVIGNDAGRAGPTSPQGRRAAQSSAPPPQSKPRRARAARAESPSDSLFGNDLISEKSLDEVILAYLSEDPSDD